MVKQGLALRHHRLLLSRRAQNNFGLDYGPYPNSPPFLRATLSIQASACDEVETYLAEAWGSRTRIDYGDGTQLDASPAPGVLHEADHSALFVWVFQRPVMRDIPGGARGLEGSMTTTSETGNESRQYSANTGIMSGQYSENRACFLRILVGLDLNNIRPISGQYTLYWLDSGR
ncbi:hypothetical protein C8R44DRAFT_862787 [Mycena epipterygia]|nr:hypothetical protein C8R44DRAFT_862787 [Mycena epipterygia]